MSWSFLYTPQSTFHVSQRLFFVGLNPCGKAGERYEEVSSCENGNDYLLGDWDRSKWKPGQAPLQLQVQTLFKVIAAKLEGGVDHRDLMNASLAVNYVPFRSPNWALLSNKERTLEFVRQLWSEILDFIQPRVIMCIAVVPYQELQLLLRNKGYEGSERQERIGWGRTNYCLTEMRKDANRIVLARLPHLSSYRVFSRESCQVSLTMLIGAVANALNKNAF